MNLQEDLDYYSNMIEKEQEESYKKEKMNANHRELEYIKKEIKEKETQQRFRVEVRHYVNGEPKTTIIPYVIDIYNGGNLDRWNGEYYEGDRIRFVAEDEEFIIKSDDLISINKLS